MLVKLMSFEAQTAKEVNTQPMMEDDRASWQALAGKLAVVGKSRRRQMWKLVGAAFSACLVPPQNGSARHFHMRRTDWPAIGPFQGLGIDTAAREAVHHAL